jgi:hypothetical protein
MHSRVLVSFDGEYDSFVDATLANVPTVLIAGLREVLSRD